MLLAWIERDFCTPSELATHLSLDPRHVSNSLGRARDKLDLSTTSQLAVFLDRRTGFRRAPSTEDQRENPADGHGDGVECITAPRSPTTKEVNFTKK